MLCGVMKTTIGTNEYSNYSSRKISGTTKGKNGKNERKKRTYFWELEKEDDSLDSPREKIHAEKKRKLEKLASNLCGTWNGRDRALLWTCNDGPKKMSRKNSRKFEQHFLNFSPSSNNGFYVKGRSMDVNNWCADVSSLHPTDRTAFLSASLGRP